MTKRLPQQRKLILGGMLGLMAFYCLVIIGRTNHPELELSVSRIVDVHDDNTLKALDFRFPISDTNDDVVVVMRVRNPGSRVVMLGKENIQPRAEGRWLETEDVSWLNSMYFVATVPARSEGEFVIAVVPRQTEAVRVALEYHEQSLPENWQSFSRLYAYNANTNARFSGLIGGVLLKLDDWVFDPLRRHALGTPWPRITVEFALTELQASAAKPGS